MNIIGELKKKTIPILKAFMSTLCGMSSLLLLKHLILNFQPTYTTFLQYASYLIAFVLAWILVYLIAFGYNQPPKKKKETEHFLKN